MSPRRPHGRPEHGRGKRRGKNGAKMGQAKHALNWQGASGASRFDLLLVLAFWCWKNVP